MAMLGVAAREKSGHARHMLRKLLRLLSTALLGLATLLIAYGLFGLSKFNMRMGEFYDDRLVLFDNGLYPFIWGTALFALAEVFRVRHVARVVAVVSAFSLGPLLWLRTRVATAVGGQQIFPDGSMLDELLLACSFLLAVALADLLIARRLKSGARHTAVCS